MGERLVSPAAHAMRLHRSARRIIALLVASFALTILGIVTATVVAELHSHRIRREASLVSEDALAAVDALAEVRTELRTMMRAVQSLEPRAAEVDVENVRRDLDATRMRLAAKFREYESLPFYPGEESLARKLALQIGEIDAAIDGLLSDLEAGERQAVAKQAITVCEPAIGRADETTTRLGDLNRRVAREGTLRIAGLARQWGWAAHAISAVLALLTAYIAVRTVRRYAALLEQRSTELEHFAERVAHDIRGPLATLSLALDLVRRDPAVETTTHQAIEKATRTLQRLRELVEGLLVFATAEKLQLATRGTNVRAVLDGVVEDTRSAAEAKGITLSYEPPSADALVGCSSGVLISIATNLLGNAVKYMGEAPVRRISVRARSLRRAVRLEVSDTGPGIPPALRAQVFDPHVRGSESKVPGLGLGLATVRRLAEAHGGRVGLRSNADAGTSFWVELPRWEAHEKRGVTALAVRLP